MRMQMKVEFRPGSKKVLRLKNLSDFLSSGWGSAFYVTCFLLLIFKTNRYESTKETCRLFCFQHKPYPAVKRL